MSTTIPALIGIEWFKLRTTLALPITFAASLLLAVAAGATNVFLTGQNGLAELGSADNVGKVLAVGALTSTAMLVLGVMIGAAEHRQRKVVGTFLGEPRRGRVLVALGSSPCAPPCGWWPPATARSSRSRSSRRPWPGACSPPTVAHLVSGALLGAAGGALVFAATYGVALPLYAVRGVHSLPVDVAGLALSTILATACYGLLGVALGALTRNMIAAIIAGLVWVSVVEVTVLQPLVPSFARWLPTGAALALTTGRHRGDDLLAPGIAALVLVGWAGLISVVALRTSVRR